MKDFIRAETRFSLCGLNCSLCPMYLGEYCPGCGGGKGNQSCAIARCSLAHGKIQFCWDCPEYPCPRYENFDEFDSFVPHRTRRQDISLARELGVDIYLIQLEEKRAILNTLWKHCDDGRHKSFFITAVYLLPLEDLQNALATLQSRSEWTDPSAKKRSTAAASLLQALADRRGLHLRLNKKTKRE